MSILPPRQSDGPENGNGGISFSATWGSRTVALRAVGIFAVVLLLWLGSIAATLFSGWRVERAIGETALANSVARIEWQREVRTKWSQDRSNDDTLACVVMLSAAQREEARRVETWEGLRQFCRWLGR